MIYKDKGELVELLKKENLWTTKELGQNFLINPTVVNKIITAAEIDNKDYIVEVGPGLGILTEQLAQKADKVRTIELDKTLIPLLKRTLSAYKNVEIEIGTALKAKLPNEKYKLVANIPYYITSPLLKHFLQPKNPEEKAPKLIVLLVQKEVAEKICAKPGENSILSLQTQIFGKPSIVATVTKGNFYPAPKVDSAIIKIETYQTPLIEEMKLFNQITSIAFNQKRKTLLNTIKFFTKLSKEETESILNKAGIAPSHRPQMLSIEDWKNLMTALPQTN